MAEPLGLIDTLAFNASQLSVDVELPVVVFTGNASLLLIAKGKPKQLGGEESAFIARRVFCVESVIQPVAEFFGEELLQQWLIGLCCPALIDQDSVGGAVKAAVGTSELSAADLFDLWDVLEVA